MRSGGGKSKGSSFERKVCESLSLWVTKGLRRDVFWRSAMSGGRATVARKRGDFLRQAGDITAVSPEGHAFTSRYYIECKHYRDLGLDAFIVSNKGLLAKFWRETCVQAAHYNREPLLIAKSNNVPILILTRRNVGMNRFPVAYLPGPIHCAIGIFNTELSKPMEVIDGTQANQETQQQHPRGWVRPRSKRVAD